MRRDELVVGFESALGYWRGVRTGGAFVQADCGSVLGSRSLSLAERADFARALCGCGDDDDLQVVAASAQGRLHSDAVRSRVWRGPLPSTQVVTLARDVAVCRMPVVVVQLAYMDCDVLDLALLIDECAGEYAFAPDQDGGTFVQAEPLVFLPEAKAYAQSCRALGVKGARPAMEALDLAAAGSESPRESALACMMRLSRAKGGFGLGDVQVNRSIPLGKEGRAILGQVAIRPDFSWAGQKTVIEYESNEHHLSPAQIAMDARRRDALLSEGYTVRRLTNEQVKDLDELSAFMGRVAGDLGIRRGAPSRRMMLRRDEVHSRLALGMRA